MTQQLFNHVTNCNPDVCFKCEKLNKLAECIVYNFPFDKSNRLGCAFSYFTKQKILTRNKETKARVGQQKQSKAAKKAAKAK